MELYLCISVILFVVLILGAWAYCRQRLEAQARRYSRLIELRAERAERDRREAVQYYINKEKSAEAAQAEVFRCQVRMLSEAIEKELAKESPDEEVIKALVEAQMVSVSCMRNEGYILGTDWARS